MKTLLVHAVLRCVLGLLLSRLTIKELEHYAIAARRLRGSSMARRAYLRHYVRGYEPDLTDATVDLIVEIMLFHVGRYPRLNRH